MGQLFPSTNYTDFFALRKSVGRDPNDCGRDFVGRRDSSEGVPSGEPTTLALKAPRSMGQSFPYTNCSDFLHYGNLSGEIPWITEGILSGRRDSSEGVPSGEPTTLALKAPRSKGNSFSYTNCREIVHYGNLSGEIPWITERDFVGRRDSSEGVSSGEPTTLALKAPRSKGNSFSYTNCRDIVHYGNLSGETPTIAKGILSGRRDSSEGVPSGEPTTLAPKAPRSTGQSFPYTNCREIVHYGNLLGETPTAAEGILSGRRDSNPRPLGPEPSALTGLSHAPYVTQDNQPQVKEKREIEEFVVFLCFHEYYYFIRVYLKLKVHPNSKANAVVRKGEDSFEVFVRAKPVDGKANEACLNLIAEFLSVPRSKIRMIRGAVSHNKTVELLK